MMFGLNAATSQAMLAPRSTQRTSIKLVVSAIRNTLVAGSGLLDLAAEEELE